MMRELPEVQIGGYLPANAARVPDRDFLKLGDERYTYREANAAVNRVAHGLERLGVGLGDSVCVMLPNCTEYVFAWLALAKLGAVTVSINTGYQDTGLERMLGTSAARVLVVDERFVEAVAAVIDRLPAIEHVIVRTADPSWSPPPQLARLEVARFADVVSDDDRDVLVPVRPAHPLMMVFTSGTTGPPKAVELSHAYVRHMANDMIEFWKLREDDVLYCCYPLYHAEAPICTVLPGLVLGAGVALGERFSASRFWDEIRRHGATWFSYLGGVLTILMKQPPRPDDAENPVRMAIGAGMPQAWREFERRFGLRLYEWYASTESGLLVFDDVEAGHRDGICGRATPYYEVKVVDDDDRELPAGEVGEIISRSRRPHGQMNGYYGNPDATLEAFRDLWYHSGDLGSIEADGSLRFVGRKKDAIRRRGVNVSAFEVEETLIGHPQVKEAAVIGVPEELGEEEIKAVVLVAEDATVEPAELLELAARRLPRAMRPRYVELVHELPKTPTDKVLKRELRKAWSTPGTWDVETGTFLGAASESDGLAPRP